jgi:hypothetical protein
MIEYRSAESRNEARPALAAERFFLGSVADQVIRIASCAIVTRREANSGGAH